MGHDELGDGVDEGRRDAVDQAGATAPRLLQQRNVAATRGRFSGVAATLGRRRSLGHSS